MKTFQLKSWIIDRLQKRSATYVFVPMLIFFLAVNAYVGQQVLREENHHRLHQLSAKSSVDQIQTALARRIQVISALAANQHVIDVIKGRGEPDNPQIHLTLNTTNEVTQSELILVINPAGTVISSTDNKTKLLTGFNYAFRPYFTESMNGRIMAFPAVGAVTRTRGLYLSAPIVTDKSVDPAGVIALKIGIDEIESILNRRSDIAALVSPDGIVFSSNEQRWLYHSVGVTEDHVKQRLKKTRQFGDHVIRPLPVDLHSGQVMVGHRKHRVLKSALPITGWYLYSCQPEDTLAPLPPLHRLVLGVGLGITGGMGVLVFLLATNILHRRKTEWMLRKAEEKYYNIFKNATMGIFQSTLDGRYLEVSPSMATTLGYDSPSHLRNAIVDEGRQVYADFRQREQFSVALERETIVNGFETQFIRHDGRRIWVSISGRIVREDPELGPYMEVFCLDITEKKQAENDLLHERNIFSKVMETLPVGIALMDRSERITYANTKAEEILQLIKDPSNPGLYAMSQWQMTDLRKQLLKNDQTPIGKVLVTGRTLQNERVRLQRATNDPLVLSFNIAPIMDSQQQIQELVVAFTDITAKVRAEKEAAMQQEQLVMADRMISLGILVAGVAHEINNPNTFILSNAELFAEAWQTTNKILDQYHKENGDFYLGGLPYSTFKQKMPLLCSRIIEGSLRIKRIVQELRKYTAQEAKGPKTAVDINAVIHSAQILLGNMIKKSTYRFVTQLTKDLPPVRGNFQRLEQVVINLIQNACQAIREPEAGITVQTFYEIETGTVVFRCTDEGVGIAEDQLSHVTDPFFTTKRDVGGIGLGLSISSSILREHGCRMIFSSTPGKGTRVTVRLPVAPDSVKQRRPGTTPQTA